ncbi:hypothetical protein NW768_005674 [Fusarium equiseti]|uniref:Uncharacterized protein n=1 Tax=Fusarium equiseti TaxID=61235 RepID=A0ABQ8RCN4_FUSEQ|nr:hypothetical protein NW768_005674 [Fusarium equiseti]
MVRSLALLAGAVVAVAAQTTTVEFFLPGYDDQILEGSVVAVKGGATTMAINCPEGTDSSDCGILDTSTIIGGPSTMAMVYYYEPNEEFGGGKIDQNMGCKLNPKDDVAICSIEATNVMSGVTESMATTTALSGYKQLLMPITVTAGADKLKDDGSAPASATGSAATTADKPKATGAQATETAESSEAAETTSASASASDATSTPAAVTDNAAGPMVTQNVFLAAAAVVGGAAMLL